MKTINVVLKKIVTDKKKGIITLKSNGDGILHIYATNKFIGLYTNMENLNQETFSFTINPHEFGTLFTENDKKKGESKLKEMEFKINKKSMKEIQTNTPFKIEPVEWDEQPFYRLHQESIHLASKDEYTAERYDFIPPSPWRYVENESTFLQVLKEGYETVKDNDDIRTMYLALRSGKALVTEERRTHIYRLSENFPFETIYLHKDVLNVLSSVIKKGTIKHKKEMDGFFVQNGEYLFKIEDNQKTVFPNLRKMATKKKNFKFEVESETLMNILEKDFKKITKNKKTGEPEKEVTEVVCRFQDGNMILIPNHPDFPNKTIPIHLLEGKPVECKYKLAVLKGFFGSFEKKVVVEHLEYRNLKNKEGYLWRVYLPEQLNVVAGISRLDYDLMDKLHKLGRLKNITTLQQLEEERIKLEQEEKEGIQLEELKELG